MGKLVDNEVFLQQLNLMYAGTKKWGTVRIIIKRCKSCNESSSSL